MTFLTIHRILLRFRLLFRLPSARLLKMSVAEQVKLGGCFIREITGLVFSLNHEIQLSEEIQHLLLEQEILRYGFTKQLLFSFIGNISYPDEHPLPVYCS